MHAHQRFLPFFSRLDDGRVVSQDQPGAAALVAGAEAARRPQHDPSLLKLASAALRLPSGTSVLALDGEAPITVDPPPHGGLAVIGLVCPPAVAAVATNVECKTLWPDGVRRDGRLAWGVNRQGASLALFGDSRHDDGEVLDSVAGTLLDVGLRSLGLDTGPCCSPTVWFPDGVFLHRLARMLHDSGGMCAQQLEWPSLSRLYPLNTSNKAISPGVTRRLRQEFNSRNTWSSLRRRAAAMPAHEPAIVGGLTPAVADWLDDGSFGRWVLSRVSDACATLEWITPRVGGRLADDLRLALGEVHRAQSYACRS